MSKFPKIPNFISGKHCFTLAEIFYDFQSWLYLHNQVTTLNKTFRKLIIEMAWKVIFCKAIIELRILFQNMHFNICCIISLGHKSNFYFSSWSLFLLLNFCHPVCWILYPHNYFIIHAFVISIALFLGNLLTNNLPDLHKFNWTIPKCSSIYSLLKWQRLPSIPILLPQPREYNHTIALSSVQNCAASFNQTTEIQEEDSTTRPKNLW